MRRLLFSTLLGLLFLLSHETKAQHAVVGHISDSKNQDLPNVSILFFAHDTLVAGTISNERGKFEQKDLPDYFYHIQYSLMGYQPQVDSLRLNANQKLKVQLQEDSVALSVLTVEANRGDLVKMNAGSTSFYLSEKNKLKTNIYEALQEIPALRIDVANRSISMIDGSKPVILINGIKRENAHELIDPKNIESVEIIENPSSKYRGEEGEITILNFRTKRASETIHAANVFAKQNLDGKFGYYSASYSMEQEKYSFYLNVYDWYLRKKTIIEKELTQTGSLTRDLSGFSKDKHNYLSIVGNGDWAISDQNYLSYGLNITANPSSANYHTTGTSQSVSQMNNLAITSRSNTDYILGNYNIYYKHSFSPSRYLESTVAFGHHNQGPDGWRKEVGDSYNYYKNIDMNANKQYARAEFNFTTSIPEKVALNVGSNTYYQHVRIDDLEENFPYSETREYIYGDIKNISKSNFSYMFSLGLDMVFRNTNHVHKNYISILPALSLSYKFGNKSALRLNVNRTRVSPEITQMNPRITTTDSFNVVVGNPYLKPIIKNKGRLSYTLNTKYVYLEPYFQYTYKQNDIVSTGKLTGNVYTSSYENDSHTQSINTGITGYFKLGYFGNLSVTPYFYKTMIDQMAFSGNSWGINGSLNLWYKSFSLNALVYYTSYSYGKTYRSKASPMIEATIMWQLPKGWSVNFGIRDNMKLNKMWVIDGNYSSFNQTNSKDQSWTPMIGFSYYFRNSSKQRSKHYQSGADIDAFGFGIK